MTAKLEAINNHLPEVEARVEKLVNAISKDCCTRGIISNEVLQSLRRCGGSKRENTKALIHHVWNPMRDDAQKAEIFIQILEKYKHCREVASKIRQDLKDIENRAKVGQAKDPSKSTMLLPPQQRRKRHNATQPTQCTGNSTKEKSIKLAATQGMCLDPGEHYNTKMELGAKDAELNEMKEKVTELQAKCDKMKQKRSDLKNRFQFKDKEVDKLIAERDALKCSNDILRLRTSTVEKKRYADRQAVAKRIAEDDKKISKLEKEKDELKTALERCDEECQKLHSSLKSYQATLDKLKSELAEKEKMKAGAEEEAKKIHTCNCQCHCRCRELLIVMCIGLIIIMVMFGS